MYPRESDWYLNTYFSCKAVILSMPSYCSHSNLDRVCSTLSLWASAFKKPKYYPIVSMDTKQEGSFKRQPTPSCKGSESLRRYSGAHGKKLVGIKE